MAKPIRPVYWKPRHATRSMQHRAWAKRSLERERMLAAERGPSLFTRLGAWLRGRRQPS
jgi:hypothetical protein